MCQKINIYCFKAWFQQQDKLETPIEEIPPAQFTLSSLMVTYGFTLCNAWRFYSSKLTVKGLCLQKFYLSVRKREGNFYNKKSLTAKEHRAAWFTGFSDVHLVLLLEIKQTVNRLIIQLVWHILQQLFASVPVSWSVVDNYLTASRLYKYPTLITHTEVNNC